MNNQQLDQFVREEGNQLICMKLEHLNPIIMINFEENIPLRDRFLCQICFREKGEMTKYLALEQAQQFINQLKQAYNEEIKRKKLFTQETIQTFLNELFDIQKRWNKIVDNTVKVITQWQIQLEKINEPDVQMTQIEFISSHFERNGNSNDSEAQLYLINKQHSSLVQKELDEFNNYNNLQQPFNKLRGVPQGKHLNQIKYREINKIQQEKLSQAIAFNNEGTLIVSGCDKYINVYEFNQQNLNLLKKLKGHNGTVTCLVFSKKQKWFFSGSSDKTIRGWKQSDVWKWISSEPGKQHALWVSCLILNKNEDKLISSSSDTTINVWTVNSSNNTLTFEYTLENGHTAIVYSISLNESENQLVSCSRDKSIILWHQDENNKWENQSIFNEINDYGYRISFIDDYQIVWQQCHRATTYFFKIQFGILVQQPELNIELNDSDDDSWLFPTIVNKTKQIIVQKYHNFIYILKKQKSGQYEISSEPLNTKYSIQYGALSNDGKYLIVWSANQSYTIYIIEDQ